MKLKMNSEECITVIGECQDQTGSIAFNKDFLSQSVHYSRVEKLGGYKLGVTDIQSFV